jgi:hypothetical protein
MLPGAPSVEYFLGASVSGPGDTFGPKEVSAMQMGLSHVDAQLRMLEQRARGDSKKPATMQDVGDLARYVRELIKVVERLAPKETA